MNISTFEQFLVIAGFTGSIAFAVSGYLLGRRKDLDMMGVFILAFLTANGGGIIRDLLSEEYPPAVMADTAPFWIALSVTLTCWIFRIQNYGHAENRSSFIFFDAIGLCAFATSGALVGIVKNYHFFGVLTLSLLTATGGGVLRDLIVNDVPQIFKGGFYGSVAILIAVSIFA